MDISGFLNYLVTHEELRWLLIAILSVSGLYFFLSMTIKSSLTARTQLDTQFNALFNAQAAFTAETEERLERLQKRLDLEQRYGKELDAKNNDLKMQIATMQGELNILKQQLGMFIACPSPECPFKNIRDTMQ